ncbi:MAG: pyridoxamine 5'-phosphate oxidase family protein [Rhodospirillales bacterium]|nr:pyridoxamine 5'-phosphate oxidase family protein [Rhodospirillales bacterium]
MSGVEARALLRRARSAALATALASDGSGGGWPYASLVTIACDADASPILLLSDLSDHTRNVARDDRASLLIEAASNRANPQTGPRVSLLGRVTRTTEERHRRRFLARHPSAGLYAGFADFNVYRMRVERAHFVGGFGRAIWLSPEDVLLDPYRAAAAADAEPALLAEWQGQRAEQAARAAEHRLARPGAGWRLIAIDPEGCDLRRRGTLSRLDFSRIVDSADELSAALGALFSSKAGGGSAA